MEQKPKFAFIVHARDLRDVRKKFPILKILPDFIVNFIVKRFPPVLVCNIRGLKTVDGENLSGIVVGFPMTASQMMKDRELAKKRIVETINFAEKRGVEIVGLGALASSLTQGGLYLRDRVKSIVTTGHSMTVAVVTENLFSLASKFKLQEIEVAIIGAGGSIGSGCAKRLLMRGVKNIILIDTVGRNERLENLKKELETKHGDINLKISNKIGDVKGKKFVITATNAPEAVLKSEDVFSGTIIINDAQPSDISPEIIEKRDDVLAIEGGLVHIPNIKYNFDFGLKDKEDVFSCLGEIIVLSAFNKKEEFSLGWIEPEKADEIWNMAQQLNIRLASPQNYKGVISNDYLNKIF